MDTLFGACAVRGVSGRRSRGGRTADAPDDARAGGVFDEACAGELLAAAGMAALPGECPVWSAPQQNAVAVMAAAENALAAVHERLGGRARYTTPLLCVPQTSVPTVWMYYAAGLLYIRYTTANCVLRRSYPPPTRPTCYTCSNGSEANSGSGITRFASEAATAGR
ncbi:MAG: hypothetical protein ACLRMJ_12615 [Alistipes finegoldii]